MHPNPLHDLQKVNIHSPLVHEFDAMAILRRLKRTKSVTYAFVDAGGNLSINTKKGTYNGATNAMDDSYGYESDQITPSNANSKSASDSVLLKGLTLLLLQTPYVIDVYDIHRARVGG